MDRKQSRECLTPARKTAASPGVARSSPYAAQKHLSRSQPPHYTLRSIISNVDVFKTNLSRSLAACQSYITEQSHEAVTKEIHYARTCVHSELSSLLPNLKTVLAEVVQLNQDVLHLKNGKEVLEKQVDDLAMKCAAQEFDLLQKNMIKLSKTTSKLPAAQLSNADDQLVTAEQALTMLDGGCSTSANTDSEKLAPTRSLLDTTNSVTDTEELAQKLPDTSPENTDADV